MSDRHFKFVRETYRLVNQAVKSGNHPFAALAVCEGQIVALALNQVVSQNDNTRHAELNLASHLSQKFSREAIEQMTVYSSTEPCTMCAGALYWIGCRSIVYGCSAQALARHAEGSFTVNIRESLASVSNEVMIEGPVLEDEGEALHRAFWKSPQQA